METFGRPVKKTPLEIDVGDEEFLKLPSRDEGLSVFRTSNMVDFIQRETSNNIDLLKVSERELSEFQNHPPIPDSDVRTPRKKWSENVFKTEKRKSPILIENLDEEMEFEIEKRSTIKKLGSERSSLRKTERSFLSINNMNVPDNTRGSLFEVIDETRISSED